MARITIDQIKEEIAPDNWTLLSEEYKNLDSELVFACPEGHQVFSTWKKIRARRECPICNQNQLKEVEQTLLPKKKGEHRVLALDQATHISGWALFSDGRLLRYGTFESNIEDEIKRDIQIKNWLIQMISNWEPDFIALEGIQYEEKFGAVTYAKLARLQGILMSTICELGIEYMVCHTATWRNYCDIKGKTRADKKRSMQLRIKEWYDVTVTDDCADAIGIGHYAITKSKKPTIEVWE